MRFRVWVTFRAASQAEAHGRTAGPRHVFCAVRMFELFDGEFEQLLIAWRQMRQIGSSLALPAPPIRA